MEGIQFSTLSNRVAANTVSHLELFVFHFVNFWDMEGKLKLELSRKTHVYTLNSAMEGSFSQKLFWLLKFLNNS